ncbi:anti-phage deoxyguanosine triphosphatase [Sphingomonas arenae]|uniref:anti-phage deoxyguanosine triphosphatase n=1 Tax=Sphingomonas arenae TaxID=2812555 RepID=UPI0019685D22
MTWEARRSGWEKHVSDARSNADIDYGRIVHSASFRRLQGKTQILNLGDSDFYRTRLTHSLEVAQIAGSITRQLRKDYEGHSAIPHLPDLALIQAIGSTHDLGHPPFGHGGEVALNYCMSGAGGFEGNGQTLRILASLEKYSDQHGADLTRRTLLGTLKYPVSFSEAHNDSMKPRLAAGLSVLNLIDRTRSKPPKCYMDSEQAVVDWILEDVSSLDRDKFRAVKQTTGKHGAALHKSLDCSIMDVSDDIAFGVHDLEDALALTLISREDFESRVEPSTFDGYFDWMSRRKPGLHNDVYGDFVTMLFGPATARKHAVSRLVGYMVENCEIETLPDFEEPLLRYRVTIRKDARALIDALKSLVYKVVIRSPSVQHLEFKGQQMVVAVFEALRSEPEAFLPTTTYALYRSSGENVRVICDHVAGMTDTFLLRTYERLFSPRMGSVFDNL